MTEQTERLKVALEGAADRPPRFNTLGLYTEALAAIEHSGLDSVNGSIIFDLMTVIERMEREDVTASDLLAERDATIQHQEAVIEEQRTLFGAAADAQVGRLRERAATIQRVRDLHRRTDYGGFFMCPSDCEAWPCSTIRALDEPDPS